MTTTTPRTADRATLLPILVALLVGTMLAGCGLFNMPNDEPPSEVRVQLNGATDTRARVVFSSTLMPMGGDDMPIFLAADTVESNLPISHRFDIDGPEFWLIITREDPGNDNMGVKVWAGDFLFVDDPVLPDTQQVVTVRYRFASQRF